MHHPLPRRRAISDDFATVLPLTGEDVRRTAADSEDAVIVGRIVGAWGMRGDVKVQSLSDFPDRFSPGSVVYLKGAATRVREVRKSKNSLVMRLDLVGGRTQAESLRGELLTVPRDQLKPLLEGGYYHFQIIDINVWTDSDEYLGDVKEILVTGVNDVYVVRDDKGKEILVPAIADVVREIDLEDNRMVVRLPEGLR